jgi:hypothetical protein
VFLLSSKSSLEELAVEMCWFFLRIFQEILKSVVGFDDCKKGLFFMRIVNETINVSFGLQGESE